MSFIPNNVALYIIHDFLSTSSNSNSDSTQLQSQYLDSTWDITNSNAEYTRFINKNDPKSIFIAASICIIVFLGFIEPRQTPASFDTKVCRKKC